jgi:hypothetical protein
LDVKGIMARQERQNAKHRNQRVKDNKKKKKPK